MFCKFCGKKLKEDAVFCSNCGKEIKPIIQQTHVLSNDVKTEIFKFCKFCGRKLPVKALFCSECGNQLENTNKELINSKQFEHQTKIIFNKHYINKINNEIKKQTKKELLKNFFCNIFKKHDAEERDDVLKAGLLQMENNTKKVKVDMFKPWLYSRIFTILLTVLIIFEICLIVFDNSNMMPAVMLIGSLVMPFTILTFYFELNIYKDISFFEVVKIFLIGGALSLLLTLFLYSVIPSNDEFDFAGASIISIIEEIGKALIVIVLLKKRKNITMMQGLLIGGAIGCGFAVFESAGYAFNSFLNIHDYNTRAGFANSLLQYQWYGYEDSIGAMNLNILLRSLLSFGGHSAWAAIEGITYAEKRKIDINFIFAFLICFVLHTLWDLQTDFIYVKLVVLCIVSWIFIFNKILKFILSNKQMLEE